MTECNTSDQANPPNLVDCVVLGEKLPGLPGPPFPGELGQRIVAQVSQKAWLKWIEHSRLLINEHGLKLSEPAARKFLRQSCEAWLFHGQTAPPEGWTPPGGGFVPVIKKPRDETGE